MNPKWLVGKVIARVEMNPFPSVPQLKGGVRPKQIAHDPRIYFTDGSSIGFNTEETEVGDYGTMICYTPAKRRKQAAR